MELAEVVELSVKRARFRPEPDSLVVRRTLCVAGVRQLFRTTVLMRRFAPRVKRFSIAYLSRGREPSHDYGCLWTIQAAHFSTVALDGVRSCTCGLFADVYRRGNTPHIALQQEVQRHRPQKLNSNDRVNTLSSHTFVRYKNSKPRNKSTSVVALCTRSCAYHPRPADQRGAP